MLKLDQYEKRREEKRREEKRKEKRRERKEKRREEKRREEKEKRREEKRREEIPFLRQLGYPGSCSVSNLSSVSLLNLQVCFLQRA